MAVTNNCGASWTELLYLPPSPLKSWHSIPSSLFPPPVYFKPNIFSNFSLISSKVTGFGDPFKRFQNIKMLEPDIMFLTNGSKREWNVFEKLSMAIIRTDRIFVFIFTQPSHFTVRYNLLLVIITWPNQELGLIKC